MHYNNALYLRMLERLARFILIVDASFGHDRVHRNPFRAASRDLTRESVFPGTPRSHVTYHHDSYHLGAAQLQRLRRR
jgi:hypothetical protein